MKPNFGIFSKAAAVTPPPIPEPVSLQQAYEKAIMNAEAAAQAQHKTKQLDLSNIIESAKAKYAEPMAKQDLAAKELENFITRTYGGREKEASIAQHLASAALSRAGASHYKWQEDQPQSAFGKTHFDIQKAIQQRDEAERTLGVDNAKVKAMTQAIDNAMLLQGAPTSTIFNGEIPSNVPPEVVGPSFQNLPKYEQHRVSKEMDHDLNMARGMSDSLKTLDQMEEIMDQNPDLWKSFELMLKDPENKQGIKEYIKRNALSEHKQTEIDKFRKLSGDLIVKGGEAFGGGQRFTDARQQLISSIKPDIANTSEANKYVINNMRQIMSEGPAWENALRWGIKNRVRIIRNPDVFRRGGNVGPDNLGEYRKGPSEYELERTRSKAVQNVGNRSTSLSDLSVEDLYR